MGKITLSINGESYEAESGMTLLEVAQQEDVHIPTLCHHRDLMPEGHCRVCLVEIEGQRSLQPACAFPAADGMVVKTNSKKVREARRMVVELLVSNHPLECLHCVRNQNCELQQLAKEVGIEEVRFGGEQTAAEVDDTSYVIRDAEKCVLCRRCTRVCQHVQGIGAIGASNRGWESRIGPAFDRSIAELECVFCGQCINYCPVGALREQDATKAVWAALEDPDKIVVVQTAPAVRVAIGEEMGMAPGGLVTGQMVSALRKLGFDRVFDTNFTADLTIMEEGHELVERLNTGGVLPIITSCCPGWIKFAEQFYPEVLPHLSTCKSPQQMFGAVAKTVYAEREGLDPVKMVVVSVMPCVAKKFEAQRPEMRASGYQDVDYVLTTRELGQMLREAGVDLTKLPESDYDRPLGASTGAAVIFGATGGVMEAALRTAYEVVTGKMLDKVDFMDVRGLEGIKAATIPLDGLDLKVGVAHGLANARKLIEQVKAGTSELHFIEVMTCPGGCLGGGGQPIPVCDAVRMERASAIYRSDEGNPLRKSHENPDIKLLYDEHLGKPLGRKSHELLHTHYTPRAARQIRRAVKEEAARV